MGSENPVFDPLGDALHEYDGNEDINSDEEIPVRGHF